MAKNVFYLCFSLSGTFAFMGLVNSALFFPAGLLFFAAILAFSSHLFGLLEDTSRNMRDAADAQVEAARSLYQAEKALDAKRDEKAV